MTETTSVRQAAANLLGGALVALIVLSGYAAGVALRAGRRGAP